MKYLLLAAILVALVITWRRRGARAAGAVGATQLTPPVEIVIDTTPDSPVAFGYKSLWLAIRTDDPEAVVEALGRTGFERANWRTGILAAQADAVFVTPAVDGWVLVVDPELPNLGHPPDEERWRARLAPLAERFPDVQYFASHRVVDYHAWARFENGELMRAYAWLGERGETLTDFGNPTAAEIELGQDFVDSRSPEAQDDGFWDRDDLAFPSEDDVMNVAGLWSVDPTTLDERGGQPGLGWLRR